MSKIIINEDKISIIEIGTQGPAGAGNGAGSNGVSTQDLNNLETNLQNQIDDKADVTTISTVGFSGNYTDLSNQPFIPTNYSDLNNLPFIPTDYNDLTNLPNIPTNITTQGNNFNSANELVQLDASGRLPILDGSQLTNLPITGANNLSELSDVDLNSLSDGDYLRYNQANNNFEVTRPKAYLTVWAEQNAAPLTGGSEFAFGNGAENKGGNWGYIIPFACKLSHITIGAGETPTSNCIIQVQRNNINIASITLTAGQNKKVQNVSSLPSFSANDTLQFYTQSTGNAGNVVINAVLEYDL